MQHSYNTIQRRFKFVKTIVGRLKCFSYNPFEMIKDAPLAFRVEADLKKRLQRLSKEEARSLSQICELLLRIGVEAYEREGPNYLRKLLPRSEKQE